MVLALSCGRAKPPAPPVPPAPTVAAAPAPPAPAPAAFRLPGDVAPKHYALDLTLDPKADEFHGEVAIDLDVRRATGVIWLNATDLKIGEATLTRDAKPVAVRVVPGGEDFVGFVPDAPLEPGPARLTIRYQGGIDKTRSRGIYRVAEGDDWYIYTFFESTDARRAFPCFDEPNYKVPWKLTVRAPKALVVAANAAQTDAKDAPDGMRAVTFADTPPLPSYLVAFVVGPFDVVDGGTAGNHGTPLRFIVPRGRGGELTYAAKATPKLVGHLEDYMGMPYPYGKLDVAVVPRYWGTMEHPGIVALGQPISLIKPGEDTVERKQFYATIAVHELAHYWFGDYVTCAWWNDTWLNEALGEWMDGKMTDAFEPRWLMPLQRLMEIHRAMDVDSLATTQKIRLPVDSKRDIENAFSGAITYSKGNAVLSMFEAYVGPAAFQKAIRRYLEDHAWGNATLDDLLAAIGAETGRPEVAPAMVTFLEQPGVPVVSVALDCPAGGTPRLRLEQQRFLEVGSKPSEQVWSIPVCARWPGGRACTLLRDKTGELALEGAKTCPAWVDGNADALGYYRVRYQGGVGRKVAAATKQLTVRERMELVSDLQALISAGESPAAEGLALLPALAREPEWHIFVAGLGLGEVIRGDLLSDAMLARRQRAMAKLWGPRARALGWKPRPGETDDDRELRPILVGAVGAGAEDKELQAQARRLALAWLDDHKAIAPDMVGVALHVAAHRGDRALFDRFVAAAKAAPDRNDRTRILFALGAFDDPAIAQAALDLVGAGAFDLREGRGVVQGLLGGRRTREVAYAWIKAHFDAIATMMRDDEVMGTFASVVGRFCDQAHRDDAAAFFGPRAKQHDGAEKVLENALENVDRCIARWKRTRPDVEAFLSKY
jgi:aminopeptidase N